MLVFHVACWAWQMLDCRDRLAKCGLSHLERCTLCDQEKRRASITCLWSVFSPDKSGLSCSSLVASRIYAYSRISYLLRSGGGIVAQELISWEKASIASWFLVLGWSGSIERVVFWMGVLLMLALFWRWPGRYPAGFLQEQMPSPPCRLESW